MSEDAIFVAESGAVRAKAFGRVRWQMTADEAEELADFIEEQTTPEDVVRQSVVALRNAAEFARCGEPAV